MATLATLAIGLTLISEAYHKGLEAAEHETAARSNNMTSLLKKVGVGVIVGGAAVIGGGILELGKVLRDSVTDAEEAQNGQAQLQAVLKSTGGVAGVTADQVNALANHYAGLTKFEDDTTIGAENMLLTFTNIGKDVFPQTTGAVLDMATAMHEDLKEASIQVGKALQDPEKGITALHRVGVAFTDQQKEMIKTMVRTGDTAGAQKVILAELYKEFGGSAEAAGKTAEGSMVILQNRLHEFMEDLGGKILPLLSTLGQALVKLFNNPGTQAGIKSLIDGVGGVANSLSALIQALSSGDPQTALLGIATAVKQAFGSGAMEFVFTALKTFKDLQDSLRNFRGDGLAGVADFLYKIGQNNLGDALAGLSLGLANLTTQGSDLKGSGIGQTFDQIGLAIHTAGQFIGEAAEAMGKLARAVIATLGPALANMLVALKAAEPAFQPLGRAIQTLMTALSALAPFIGALLVGILGVIVAVIGAIANAIGPFVTMIAGLLTAVVTVFTGIVQIITGLFQIIVGLVLGNSATVQAGFDSMGKGVITIITGLVGGIVALWKGVNDTVDAIIAGFVQTIKQFFVNLFEELVGHSIIPDMVTAILGSFTTLVDQGTAKISGFIQKLLGLFRDSVAAFLQVGKDIMTGIWTGINSIWGSFWNDMVFKWNQVIAITKSIFHSHSPSQVFADIGAGLMEGMAQGISQAAPQAQRAVTQASANVIHAAQHSTTFSITAQYPYRPEASLASDVRQLALVYGAG